MNVRVNLETLKAEGYEVDFDEKTNEITIGYEAIDGNHTRMWASMNTMLQSFTFGDEHARRIAVNKAVDVILREQLKSKILSG